MKSRRIEDLKIAVIGLGYVGLPLAVAFARQAKVVGLDRDNDRVVRLRNHQDETASVSEKQLEAASANLMLTTVDGDIADCTCFIVAVPTPVDASKQPDLTALVGATETVAKYLKPADIVIFESTVFPGATEEVCGSILAERSGLSVATTDDEIGEGSFCLGYSPERVNPGDTDRGLTDIVKLTSGSSPAAADFVSRLYGGIIKAGVFECSSIRVAEAAKVIENIQRDVNIALVNDLALLFSKLNLDTESVLQAAETKWNFIPFRPGLVGGHCIGIDPYYLTYKAVQVGHNPNLILAGRQINETMSLHVASEVVKLLLQNSIEVLGARVLVLGLTFKENCPDTRNSKVFDLIGHLQSFGCVLDVHDPLVDSADLPKSFEADFIVAPKKGAYEAIVLAVPHREFVEPGPNVIRNFGKSQHIFYDVKYAFPSDKSDGRL